MANSKRKCQICKEFRPLEEMSVYGLTATCDLCKSGGRFPTAKALKNPRPYKNKPPRTRDRGASAKIKTRIRARDRNRCRFCGSTGFLQVHHILYRSQGGPDTPPNLITLCEEHHSLVHSDKHYWQPILLASIWIYYVEGKLKTVPQVEYRLLMSGLIHPPDSVDEV